MNKEFKEILIGFKRAIDLISSNKRGMLWVACFIMIVTGTLTNLPALILGKLVDQLITNSQISFALVYPFIALIILIIILREGLTIVRKLLVENIATYTEKEQTVKVIEGLLKTDIANYLHKQQVGSLHGRIFRSLQGLVRLIKLGFLDFLPIFFSALAALIIALTQKPLIAGVMILVVPAGLYLIIKQVGSQKNIRVSLLRGKERVDGKVVEMLSGIETIRVANTVSTETNKIESIAEDLRKKEIKHHVSMSLFDAAKYLNEGLFYIIVIVLAIYLSALGIISRGDILVYSILFLSITGPLREIHRILDEAHENSIRVNDLYELLRQPNDPSFDSDSNVEQSKNADVIIEASNLSFGYAAGQDGAVINHLNLAVRRGEHIGLVGASGCGKTTFIQILLKLLHSYTGDVTLFGKDLQNITREEIAHKIAYVPQKPFIFSGTIRENILYGNIGNPSETEIVTAAKQANIYNEIVSSLGSMEGVVTENGNNLSGGQKQRIAIARILLQSPELLIFDEATSALDNTNESLIQANIEQRFQGKTIISIAHRLTTLKNCDKIFVFDKGKIVQEGDFNTLSNTEGLFKTFLMQSIKSSNQNLL